jgi:hypothetical protein
LLRIFAASDLIERTGSTDGYSASEVQDLHADA